MNALMQEKSIHMQTIGDRIRLFGLSKYGKIKDFADAMHMKPSNLQLYMSGRREPGTVILQRISAVGGNTDWVLTGEGEMLSGKRPLNGREEEIKRRFNVEDDEGYYREGNAYMVPAIGPLQTPEKIKEGDVLFIDPNATPEDGDFVLVKVPEGPKIERYTPGEPIVGVLVKVVRERSVIRQ